MKKVLYLMHIDWNWIKQRPHFIAEKLKDKGYDIRVLSPLSRKRKNLTKNEDTNVKLCPYLRIPLRDKFKFLSYIDEKLVKFFIKFQIIMYKPDYIWVTFPELNKFLPQNTSAKIIYDCMDDAVEFFSKTEQREIMQNNEKELIKRANLLLASSEYLKNKLLKKYNVRNEIYVIRNAHKFTNLTDKTEIQSERSINTNFKICYFGTISSWFDNEAITCMLNNFNNVEIHLIGPIEDGYEKLTHNRLKYYGPVDHRDLAYYVSDADCFIMPFILNELIKSVDPVKLYEYIYFNKSIISVYYDEIRYFNNFVEFYDSKDDLKKVLEKIILSNFEPKYSNVERLKFLKDNTWDSRVNEINKLISTKI